MVTAVSRVRSPSVFSCATQGTSHSSVQLAPSSEDWTFKFAPSPKPGWVGIYRVEQGGSRGGNNHLGWVHIPPHASQATIVNYQLKDTDTELDLVIGCSQNDYSDVSLMWLPYKRAAPKAYAHFDAVTANNTGLPLNDFSAMFTASSGGFALVGGIMVTLVDTRASAQVSAQTSCPQTWYEFRAVPSTGGIGRLVGSGRLAAFGTGSLAEINLKAGERLMTRLWFQKADGVPCGSLPLAWVSALDPKVSGREFAHATDFQGRVDLRKWRNTGG